MDVSVDSLLKLIDEPNQVPARAFWDDLNKHLPKAKGSNKSHQAWDGGYEGHIQEVMNLAIILHRKLGLSRPLPFSLSSALLVLFLHDCEKPFKQATDAELKKFQWIKKRPVKSDKEFQKLLIAHYGFVITDEEQNALNYVEKVPDSDYVEGERIDGPLAAFCHVCDNISARIWYDYPKRNTT